MPRTLAKRLSTVLLEAGEVAAGGETYIDIIPSCVFDQTNTYKKICRNSELNQGHRDFQSLALPTELLRHIFILLSSPTRSDRSQCLLYLLKIFNQEASSLSRKNNKISFAVPTKLLRYDLPPLVFSQLLLDHLPNLQ